jgi:hypothetical protein
MTWMEGDLCIVMETHKDHCFDMHMSTSVNQNIKKHLEEMREHLQI